MVREHLQVCSLSHVVVALALVITRYGIIYGEGPGSLGCKLGVREETAKAVIAKFTGVTFPEIARFKESSVALANKVRRRFAGAGAVLLAHW